MSTDDHGDAHGWVPAQPQPLPPQTGLQPPAVPVHQPGPPPGAFAGHLPVPMGAAAAHGPGLTMFPQPYKDTAAAWLFWVFLGHVGAHDFYLRRTGAGVTKLVLSVVGWLTVWLFIGILPLLAVLVWWIVDACTMSGRLEVVNGQVFAHNRAFGAVR